ncbi:MAG: YcgN family cysteine cluster protein [Proteobacteria bacterium]|nr:YcgN family cysteine cluster protein [Pseudomonadota bacterium]
MKELEPEFWKKKPLHKLNKREWEALCAHCGRCCLIKHGEGKFTFFTNTYCKHLHPTSCNCQIYDKRLKGCNCIKVDYHMLKTRAELLPDDCAYKLILNNQDLPSWHPLVSGNPESVHLAGKSVRGMLAFAENALVAQPLQFLFMVEKK